MDIPPKVRAVLKRFWKANQPKLEQWYAWDFPKVLPIEFSEVANETSARKTIRLRRALAKEWKKTNARRRRELETWYVGDWGHVRSNKPDTLLMYSEHTLVEIVAHKGLSGVASWSKMIAIRDPDRYAIYDARVAFSLNAIQMIEAGHLMAFFPIPPGRNSTLLEASGRIRRHKSFGTAPRVPRAEAYDTYLTLLRDTSGDTAIEELEMLLFSAAERLAGKL